MWRVATADGSSTPSAVRTTTVRRIADTVYLPACGPPCIAWRESPVDTVTHQAQGPTSYNLQRLTAYKVRAIRDDNTLPVRSVWPST